MRTRQFDVEATIPVDPQAAIDFLGQLDRHRGLHAYVQEATLVEQGTHHGESWARWSVAETPRLGSLSYTLRFDAHLTRTSPTTMTAVVRPGFGSTLETRTRAEAADGGARVVETVIVTAPRIALSYMAGQARIAHERLFRLLPTAFDGSST